MSIADEMDGLRRMAENIPAETLGCENLHALLRIHIGTTIATKAEFVTAAFSTLKVLHDQCNDASLYLFMLLAQLETVRRSAQHLPHYAEIIEACRDAASQYVDTIASVNPGCFNPGNEANHQPNSGNPGLTHDKGE